MLTPPPEFRFKAVSMELGAHLDDHRVDMLIITSDGTKVAIECEGDVILNVQPHIAAITEDCPAIGTWSRRGPMGPDGSSPSEAARQTADALNAAVSEGWPTAPPDSDAPTS
jgi:hypothetical protein